MNDILLLHTNDIPMLIGSISGNLDLDRITPYVKLTQRNEIKRILGIELYNKILVDFENNTLTGLYKNIYENYVVDMLVNYSAYNIVIFNGLRVDNAGNFYNEPINTRSATVEESEKIAKRYQSLGAAVELQFNEFVKKNKIKEVKGSGCDKNKNSYKLNWFLK